MPRWGRSCNATASTLSCPMPTSSPPASRHLSIRHPKTSPSKAPRTMAEIVAGPEAIALGVRLLSEGYLVAFPTETVYGLGADALNPDAVASVFALKGRPSHNPLIVHVSDEAMAQRVVRNWPEAATKLARAFWPGPLTLVLPKTSDVPDANTAGGDTVAVRCPEHPVALALIESFAKPIVGPSANPSGYISPTTPEHVRDAFAEEDLLVIDGGHCRAGIESTVLDLTGDSPAILRQGVIGAHRIAEVLGCDVQVRAAHQAEDEARSPGLIGAHYQPRTPARLVSVDELASAPSSAVLIAWSIESHPAGGALITMPQRLAAYAQAIYRALHEGDRSRGDQIWVESPPSASDDDERAIAEALHERLRRATQR
ncbi:MAG TPA: threonylcarbamoyl-AMP synthase [Phycisphaerales bacterium]|nr:threonylcarbamoyl-AMP synthase [Phycisphaerales bacterium]